MSAILIIAEQATFELSSSVSHWGMWLLIEHRCNGWYTVTQSDVNWRYLLKYLLLMAQNVIANFLPEWLHIFSKSLELFTLFPLPISQFKADVSLVHRPVIEPVTCNLLTSFLRNVSTASFTFLLIFLWVSNIQLKPVLTDIHCLPCRYLVTEQSVQEQPGLIITLHSL